MTRESPTCLVHRQTGKVVDAVLVEDLTIREVELAEVAWKPTIKAKLDQLRQDKVPEKQWPQHLHWDWRRKYKKTSYLNFKWVGLRCDGDWQGLLLMELAQHFCQLASQKGKPLVYLQYMATAPWNHPHMVDEPLYSLVGKNFMSVAIQESWEQEFKGRIGLHALHQAERYYADICKMTDLGPDPIAENMHYFEMTPEHAVEFLKTKMTKQ